MLKGVLMVLFAALGRGLIFLGYGKEAMQARKRLELDESDKGLAFFFSIVFFIWVMDLFFLPIVRSTSEKITTIAIAIVVPVLYIIWFICARKSGKKYIEEDQKLEQERVEKWRREEREREERELREKQERQERERLEEQRKAEALKQLQQSMDGAGAMAIFLSEAEACDRVKDIASLWANVPMEDNALTGEITKKIEATAMMERMYGMSANNTKRLIENIKAIVAGEAQM